MDPRYNFAVSCHMLIPGGFGHRPLGEESVLCGSYLTMVGFIMFYGKLTHTWAFFII